MQRTSDQRYSFDEFTVDLPRACLLRDGREVKLRPKSFEAFKYLIENRGRLVTKEELIGVLWPNSFVTDDSLVKCLRDVRLALGDDSHRYVKTVPRRGYIFEAELIEHDLPGRELVYMEEVEGLNVAIEEETQDGEWTTGGGEVATRQEVSVRHLVSGIGRRKLELAALIVTLLTLGGLGAYLLTGRGRDSQAIDSKVIDSIVILPFVNAGGDPNTEYLSDGIPEALINSLTELRQLRVIARSTAFHYKGREVDLRAVGRELRVRAVLMGRVRQIGNRLDVQVDLVDATTGAQLWGAGYERPVSDTLAVKQAIARDVTEKLRLRLSGEDERRLAKRDTMNAEAYQFYLRGRYFWNKRTANGLRKAIEQFQQAIERDPTYALGHVGLADCYLLLEQYAGVPAIENLPKAKAAADRALQLDDSLSEAHASLALIYQYQWRWVEAEKEFKRAISLNPNYPTAHHWLSIHFQLRRLFDEYLQEIKLAQELDPLSPVISDNVSQAYFLKNDFESAIEQSNKIIELDPSFPYAHSTLGFAYLKQQRYEVATIEFQKAVELSSRASQFLGDLGYCYALTGRRAEALAVLRELEERYAKRESIGMYLASVYAGLGDKDQAFAWLEKDFQQRSGMLGTSITWWFPFEDLRTDPRYADLLGRVGLSP